VTNEMHDRAESLIAKERVEGLSTAEQDWLAQHLRECARCADSANATAKALRSLRTVGITFPRELARRTQFRVRLRARELQAREPRWRLLWAMCGASWVAGAATAPYVWRGLAWAGHHLGLPDMVWKLGFGLWWALPAMVAGAILLVENAGLPVRRNPGGAA